MNTASSQMPLITFIVAVKNAGETLGRCLDSVLAQDYPFKELVVVDGASTDGSIQILERYSDRLAYWHSKADGGIYAAWNQAILKSKGDWVCFLGADDYLWSPSVLSNFVPKLVEAFPSYRVAYGRVNIVNSGGEVLQTVGDPWDVSSRMIHHELSIPHQGVFQHRTLFEEFGKFDETFRITGDYDFLLRELKSRPALFIEGAVLTGMQIGGVSSLVSNTLLNISELRRARRNNGITFFSIPLFWRESRARLRRILQLLLGEKVTFLIADLYRVSTGKRRIWTRDW